MPVFPNAEAAAKRPGVKHASPTTIFLQKSRETSLQSAFLLSGFLQSFPGDRERRQGIGKDGHHDVKTLRKSRYKVNGVRNYSVSQSLKLFGENLIRIYSRHLHQMLLS